MGSKWIIRVATILPQKQSGFPQGRPGADLSKEIDLVRYINQLTSFNLSMPLSDPIGKPVLIQSRVPG
jgi:hypothetical protein